MKTIKTLAAAVTTLVAAAMPAHAALSLNGVELNGFRANGLSLNGVRANGVFLNGFRTNGLSLNGFKANGTAYNGEATVGEIVAVSLPSATPVKCELARW